MRTNRMKQILRSMSEVDFKVVVHKLPGLHLSDSLLYALGSFGFDESNGKVSSPILQTKREQLTLGCLTFFLLQHDNQNQSVLQSIFLCDEKLETNLDLYLGARPQVHAHIVENVKDLILDLQQEKIKLLICEENQISENIGNSYKVLMNYTHSVQIQLSDTIDENNYLLAKRALYAMFLSKNINYEQSVQVIASNVQIAAVVAMGLLKSGHEKVSLCIFSADDIEFDACPGALKYSDEDIIHIDSSQEYDVSPLSTVTKNASKMDREDSDLVEKSYKEAIYVMATCSEKPSIKFKRVVVFEEGDHSYFDVPQAVTKELFLSASRDIFRLVSFVVAPCGLPDTLRNQITLEDIKACCDPLLQDIIEVCSDLVYSQRGLSEGAMAMSVYKWVDTKRDPDCLRQVQEINNVFDLLYNIPRVVEVPSMDPTAAVKCVNEISSKVREALYCSAKWALDEIKTNSTSENMETPYFAAQCIYPSVMYSLGYLPDSKKRKKHSTFHIKSFIQAVAEVGWDHVTKMDMSQVEFQAFYECLSSEERNSLKYPEQNNFAELYVTWHVAHDNMKEDELSNFSTEQFKVFVDEGDRHKHAGRHHKALTAYSSALNTIPLYHRSTAKVLASRSKILSILKRNQEAKCEATVALKIDAFCCEAYDSLGILEEEEGNTETSMQHFVTAFVLDGSRSPVYADKIDCLSKAIGKSTAKNFFEKMPMTHDLPSRWLVESYFDSFEHDIDHAIVLPSNISRTSDPATSPKSLEELFHKMIYLKRNKKYSEAKKCIDELLNMDLTSEVLVVVYNLHASFLYISGDVVAALETITEAVQHTFGKVNSLVKKAGFHCELGEIEEARICFNEAQLIDSNDSDVYLHWGQMDLINGNYDDAVRHLRKCISRSEALLVSHVSYAMALYKSGSIYQAMDVFENALLLFPQSTEAHLFFGEALADQGNYLDAMYHFYTAFRLSPDCPLPFLHAGRVYVSTNDPTRAISHFERALQIDPRCSSAHLDLAQVFFAQGRTEEALNHFDLAADNCRFLPEVEEVCSCKAMARMQLRVTEILGVELRHMMKVK